MHTHQIPHIRAVGRVPALFSSLVLPVLASLVCVASAHAAVGSQFSLGKYGEVPSARFGAFDTTWYDNGHFDGNGGEDAPTPGDFLYPTGFAVDTDDPTAPSDDTAIYVLDRVSDVSVATTEQGTRWRLQKLSDTGEPLAVTEFFLPKAGTQPGGSGQSTVEARGLAVSGGNVYTVISATTGTGQEGEKYAEEIVGWSTTPAGGKLVPATATPDQVSSPVTVSSGTYARPGVVSTKAQLEATPVFSPHGLTVDGADSLAVLGNATNRYATNPPATSGAPAIVVKVAIAGGEENAHWSSASVPGLALEAADSISTDTNTGDIDVLLYQTSGAREGKVDLVDLHPDLTAPNQLEGAAQEPSDAFAYAFGINDGPLASAGPHGVWLSNGLYASLDQIGNSIPFSYWGAHDDEGIRLTSPLSDGTLSNPAGPYTTYDTLGKNGSACDISAGSTSAFPADVAFAPGTSGSLWMLNVGNDPGSTHAGRVVAEFAPNTSAPCVTPPSDATFSLTDENAATPTPQLANAGPLTTSVRHKIRFDTEPFEYPNPSLTEESAAVYEYEWDPIGGSPNDQGYTLVDQAHSVLEILPIGKNDPSAEEYWTTDEYQYNQPGTYTVEMKAFGEMGEFDTSGTVIVEAGDTPEAEFTLPSSGQTNQPVPLNASGSFASHGSTITDYHWNFGDGQVDDTTSATDAHEYAGAGTYTVTLAVLDSSNQHSTTVSHQITITAPSGGGGSGDGGSGSGGGGSTGGGGGPSGGGTSSTGGGSTTPSTGSTAKPAPTKKPSAADTAKTKLAAALKVCKKKPAKKRAACEKQARAKFSGKSKTKKK
jgi:PKD domain